MNKNPTKYNIHDRIFAWAINLVSMTGKVPWLELAFVKSPILTLFLSRRHESDEIITFFF